MYILPARARRLHDSLLRRSALLSSPSSQCLDVNFTQGEALPISIHSQEPTLTNDGQGEWTKDSAAGGKSLEQTLRNPQFLIVPSEAMRCNFILTQPKKAFNPIGLCVIRAPTSGAMALAMCGDDRRS